MPRAIPLKLARQLVDALPELRAPAKTPTAARRAAERLRSELSGRKRLAIDVPRQLMDELDRLVQQLGLRRQTLVVMALQRLVDEHDGGLTRHGREAWRKLHDLTGAPRSEVLDFALQFTLQEALRRRRIEID